MPFLVAFGDPCIQRKENPPGLTPKVCFIMAQTIEGEVRQIGETQEAARKLEVRTLRSTSVCRCYPDPSVCSPA